MISRTNRIFSRLPMLLVAMFSIVACSSNGNNDSFPQVAYPPPFDYIDGEELRSRMHQLAFELQQLDLSLLGQIDDRTDVRDDVVENLQNIERIAGVLQEGDLSSAHPFLLDDMDRFVADVQRARMDASSTNPRYYMAGRISGSCVNCHRANQ